jgi:hypothetical protein
MSKILAENFGGKLWRKILASHKIQAGIQKLGAWQKFRRTIELWRALKSLRLGKISAPKQNLSGKVWRPLTIWARQNL